MALIFGFVAWDAGPELPTRRLEELLAQRLAAPWETLERTAAPHAAAAATRPRSDFDNAAVARNGELVLAVAGGGGVRTALPRLAAAAPAAPDRRLLPVGWAAARIEPGQLVVATDLPGSHPLFIRRFDGGVAFSGSPLPLARLVPGAPLDPQGLAELLSFGQLLGQRTLFREVEAVPAGAILTLTPEGQRLERHVWPRWPAAEDPNAGRIGEALAALRAAVVAASGRRGGLLLSGGVDSRLLLALLMEQQEDLRAYTFGEAGCADIAIARRVAARTHTPHNVRATRPADLEAILHHAVALTGGMVSALHLHGTELLARMRREVDVQWNGFAGDAILGGSFAHPRYAWSHRPITDVLYDKLNTLLKADALGAVLDRDLAVELAEHPREAVVRAVADAGGGSGAEIAFRVLMAERVGRLAALGLAIDRHYLPVLAPYTHGPVIALMQRMPERDRRYARLLRAALGAARPDLAALPWQRTGAPPSAPWPWLAAARTLRSLGVRLGIARTPELIDYGSWLRGPLAPLRQRLIGALADLEAFDGDRVRRLAAAPAGSSQPLGLDGVMMTLGALVEIQSGAARETPATTPIAPDV